MKDSQMLREPFKLACEQMKDFVTMGIKDKADFAQLRACINVIGAYTRLRAVENTESVLKFSVARAMTRDTKDLKDQLKKSLPEYINK